MTEEGNGNAYNMRLFSRGLRGRLHSARFHWVIDATQRLSCPTDSILELGCFDGKLIDFLPKKPERYWGLDANWEGGLDLAKERWGDQPGFHFREVTEPEHVNLEASANFQLAVCMETLEHVPPDLVDGYLRAIAKCLDGYFLITVPNEKGLLFIAKWFAKAIFTEDSYRYSFSELLNSIRGRMDRVKRHEHKGFDYDALVAEVSQYFDIVEVSGIPMRSSPRAMWFGVGIIAKSKT